MCFASRLTAACVVFSVLALGAVASDTKEDVAKTVRAAEVAFAKTMEARDLAAFEAQLADEAVFFGSKEVFRGKRAIVAAWKRYFEGDKAPFSWKPEQVEVLDSGTLALSSGPVLDPDGKRIGTFNSVWRKEADGRWRIVLDKGCPPCDCAGKP